MKPKSKSAIAIIGGADGPISRELYIYYGVSGDDIKNKTKRYAALVTELSL